MAAQTGTKTPNIIESLLEDPKSFSYFQALRLIYLFQNPGFKTIGQLLRREILITASTSLGFPSADLVKVNYLKKSEIESERGPVLGLTVTFMGLHGSASPLPPFYAQEIKADERQDDDSCKKLFDLISLPSYRHHAEAYFHNKLPFRLLAENDRKYFDILNSLMGLGQGASFDRLEDNLPDLAYLWLLATQSRNARGLEIYINSLINTLDASIEQCLERWVDIPNIQRLQLGSGNLESRSLGRGALVGRKALDVNGKFRISITVKDNKLFNQLSPGGLLRKRLEALIGRYLSSPLVYDLKLTLLIGVAQATRLGASHNSSLGRSSFLSPPKDRPLTIYSPCGLG
ncbi:MAG: type VI secretion system baseplate subunit TssG [Deltaproteobacteria bacterium]|jgi:type VI secretion system protein ImpH|nr:type VI secretion system baseplate subunit TssG [Deltaproteobacteria bacterium]